MSYTSVSDKTSIDTIGATLLNQIINNIKWVANEKTIFTDILLAGSSTTKTGAGSDTFANIDSTNLTISYTPSNTRVLVACLGTFSVSAGNAFLDWFVTGLNVRLATQYNNNVATGAAANGLVCVNNGSVVTGQAVIGIFTGLTANTAYTFTVQWRQSSTANTLSWANTSHPATLLAMEI